jgi:hypothetical protein
MNGLMMDDYPLVLTRIVDRAEQIDVGRQTAPRKRFAEGAAGRLARAAEPC